MDKTIKKLIKIGVVIGAIAGTMYAINKYIEKASNLINKLKEKEHSFYNWKLGKIYYEKKGAGSPILLIHDFTPYASSYEWNNIISRLSKTHTVYTIDLLGCGRSDRPAIEYTSFMYVQLITDFINEIIGEKTDIITSGYSSSFAIMSTNYTCENIGKLLLINPGDIDVITRKPCIGCKLIKTIIQLPLVGTFLYNLFTLRGNIDHILTEKYFYNAFHLHSDMIDTYYKSAHKVHGNGKYILASIIANYTTVNIEHLLNFCDTDIHIVGGKYQENIKSTIDSYKTIKPEITSHIILKAKKLPHFETPDEVIEQIVNYL